jgi:hypothetical protein
LNKTSRRILNENLRKNSSFKMRATACMAVASTQPVLANDVNRQRRCSSKQPCNRYSCGYCGFRRERSTSNRKTRTPSNLSRATPKRKHQPNGSRDRTSVVVNTMRRPFPKHTHDNLIPITINFSYEHPFADYADLMRHWRKRLQKIISTKLPDATLHVLIDFAPSSSDKISPTFRNDAIGENVWPADPDPKPVFLFHAHGIIWHPILSVDAVATILRRELTGSRRIAIGTVQPVRVDASGALVGGIEGWLEYCAMEKVELDYTASDRGHSDAACADPITGPLDNVRVFTALALARDSVKRNARWIKYIPKSKSKTNRVRSNSNGLSLIAKLWISTSLTFCGTTLIDELVETQFGIIRNDVYRIHSDTGPYHGPLSESLKCSYYCSNCIGYPRCSRPLGNLRFAAPQVVVWCSRPDVEKPP